MAGKSGSFWLGVVVGFIVMILLGSLPVLGPVVGGFVAGIIARGGAWNGAVAGFTSGILGAIIIGVVFTIGGSLVFGVPGFLMGMGVSFFAILAALYFAILGFVGGAIGAAIAR
jgi:hypothetical protein